VPSYIANFAGIAALIAAGYAVTYAVLRRSVRREVARQTEATEQRLADIAAMLAALEARQAEQVEIAGMQAAAAPEFDIGTMAEAEAATPPAEEAAYIEDADVTPEIMPVLEAAVTAFLGKKVRILSARLLETPPEATSAWSQQGRVFVQSSHNLR
jgi:methylmalonyl-CoA carboxyltransferase large subunit